MLDPLGARLRRLDPAPRPFLDRVPEHIKGGELERFDRVITNPPFSQNYDRSTLKHPERFRYGYTPEGGKKADLMFLQNMIAVLKRDAMLATVMPHGVLFRGGEEGKRWTTREILQRTRRFGVAR